MLTSPLKENADQMQTNLPARMFNPQPGQPGRRECNNATVCRIFEADESLDAWET